MFRYVDTPYQVALKYGRDKIANFLKNYYRVRHGKLVFIELALTERNMQVRFYLKVDLEC